MDKVYDIIVLGAGPAGLTAASYAGRARMDTLLIEGTKDGGQIVITNEIENYPGSLEEESGPSLIARMTKQVEKFGADRVTDTIVDVELEGKVKHLKGNHGDYYAKAVVIATGASPRPIGCPGEKEFTGKGVSYCATCDGMFYRGKTVVIVGGGNTAVADALFLSKICKKVYLVHRRDELRASKTYMDSLNEAENLEFIWNSEVVEVLADDLVTGVKVKNKENCEVSEIDCDGVFVAIGNVPNTELVKGQIDLDEGGYVLADETTRTNIPGVYAVGDLRKKPLRQIVTAVADGAVASKYIEEYIAVGE